MSDLRSSDAMRRAVRAYLLARDGNGCHRCGEAIEDETPSIGHVIARARGGSDASSNLRLEHLQCNQRAGVDRDRARIVNVTCAQNPLHDSAHSRVDEPRGPAVFLGARIHRTEPSAASNGARKRPEKRTTVRFRLIER